MKAKEAAKRKAEEEKEAERRKKGTLTGAWGVGGAGRGGSKEGQGTVVKAACGRRHPSTGPWLARACCAAAEAWLRCHTSSV